MTGELQSDDTLECGCAVHFDPCEKHLARLNTGKETVQISVRFDDKNSRFAGNRHNVNLERVQRIQLGLDSEPMEFSEVTIADMLQDMADERPFETEAFVLRALANALHGKDEHHRLLLKQNKPGKWESPAEHEGKFIRHRMWLYWLASLEKEGWKTEAAINEIATKEGVSRATVFAGVKDAENFQETGRKIAPDNEHFANPRPAKDSNS